MEFLKEHLELLYDPLADGGSGILRCLAIIGQLLSSWLG